MFKSNTLTIIKSNTLTIIKSQSVFKIKTLFIKCHKLNSTIIVSKIEQIKLFTFTTLYLKTCMV